MNQTQLPGLPSLYWLQSPTNMCGGSDSSSLSEQNYGNEVKIGN